MALPGVHEDEEFGGLVCVRRWLAWWAEFLLLPQCNAFRGLFVNPFGVVLLSDPESLICGCPPTLGTVWGKVNTTWHGNSFPQTDESHLMLASLNFLELQKLQMRWSRFGKLGTPLPVATMHVRPVWESFAQCHRHSSPVMAQLAQERGQDREKQDTTV